MKNIIKSLLTVILASLSFPAFAANGTVDLNPGLAVIGAGVAGLGAAIGIAILAGRLLEAIARQPELEDRLSTRFFLGVGLTDAVPIIVIVLSILIIFG